MGSSSPIVNSARWGGYQNRSRECRSKDRQAGLDLQECGGHGSTPLTVTGSSHHDLLDGQSPVQSPERSPVTLS
jgi:hypothetical protein